jgi:predicted ATPase
MQGPSNEAVAEIRQAIGTYRATGTRLHGTHHLTLLAQAAATCGDLARLWGEQGRRVEASDLLGQVYGWFTEGSDTADLKEAKALLDQLA